MRSAAMEEDEQLMCESEVKRWQERGLSHLLVFKLRYIFLSFLKISSPPLENYAAKSSGLLGTSYHHLWGNHPNSKSIMKRRRTSETSTDGLPLTASDLTINAIASPSAVAELASAKERIQQLEGEVLELQEDKGQLQEEVSFLRDALERRDTVIVKYSTMSSEVQQISDSGSEVWDSEPYIGPDKNALWELVGRCLGRSLGEKSDKKAAMDHLLKFRPCIAIQALTMTALCIWVLEFDYILEPQSEVFTVYGGEPIAEGIKNLAARLNDTLTPLFSCLNSTWPGVDEHIQKAFEYALKLKADSWLDHYMVLPYRPGSRFNEGTMVSHLGSGVQGRFVDLCVQPALFCSEDGSHLDAAHTAVKAVVAFLER